MVETRTSGNRLHYARRARRDRGLLTLGLAAAIVVTGIDASSMHRRDEYLQAARIDIARGHVQLELDLTPGIALADAMIAAVDLDRDGSLSTDEQRAYGSLVMSALTIDVDGRAVQVRLDTCRFPDTDAMRRGEGTIRLQSAAALPQLSNGPHHLRFRNRHHPEGSVYLANALVPGSADVAITAQRRDSNQTELTIDYQLRGAPSKSPVTVLLGSLAAAAMLVVLWMRRARAAR